MLDETEIFIKLNIIRNLTETDLDKNNVRFALEEQTQKQETKIWGWRFDKIESMTIYLYETGEANGSSYVKFPLRNSASLKFQNVDKYCFLWSILAKLHP